MADVDDEMKKIVPKEVPVQSEVKVAELLILLAMGRVEVDALVLD